MLSTLKNAWKEPQLRKRIFFVIFFIIVYRIGNVILVPGVDTAKLSELIKGNGLLGFYDFISGGSFSNFSIFANNVGPYINASIIMQLLTLSIPSLEALSKEGNDGRKKIQQYTRYVSVVISMILSYGTYLLISQSGAVKDNNPQTLLIIILSLMAGSAFLIWLGDMITVYGIGNGISLLIFVNIISGLPKMAGTIYGLFQGNSITAIQIILFIAGAVLLLIGVIYTSLAERRIQVQYAGKTVGTKSYKGQQSHIPISLTASAVIGIIFAMSVLEFPKAIGQLFFSGSAYTTFVTSSLFSPFNNKGYFYVPLYIITVIFFSWFYLQITLKPEEMAENIHKSAGVIPGKRQGKETEQYLDKVILHMGIIGGVIAAIIAVIPIIVTNAGFEGVGFGGTSLLIMVGVSLEFVRVLEAQLTMRHYEGFLK